MHSFSGIRLWFRMSLRHPGFFFSIFIPGPINCCNSISVFIHYHLSVSDACVLQCHSLVRVVLCCRTTSSHSLRSTIFSSFITSFVAVAMFTKSSIVCMCHIIHSFVLHYGLIVASVLMQCLGGCPWPPEALPLDSTGGSVPRLLL